MAAYGYIRVSTDEQATEGHSLSQQKAVIEAMAGRAGLEVADWFTEAGVSGKTPLADRPEGRRLLAAIEAGDQVFASKVDRMFRDSADALVAVSRLAKSGIAVRFGDVPEDPAAGVGRLLFTVLAAFAHREGEAVSERTAAVAAKMKRDGKRTGGRTPLGMTLDRERKELTGQDQQRRLVARMADLKASGLSLRQIADTLTAEGVKVSFATVRRYLDRAPALQAEGAEA